MGLLSSVSEILGKKKVSSIYVDVKSASYTNTSEEASGVDMTALPQGFNFQGNNGTVGMMIVSAQIYNISFSPVSIKEINITYKINGRRFSAKLSGIESEEGSINPPSHPVFHIVSQDFKKVKMRFIMEQPSDSEEIPAVIEALSDKDKASKGFTAKHSQKEVTSSSSAPGNPAQSPAPDEKTTGNPALSSTASPKKQEDEEDGPDLDEVRRKLDSN